MYEGAAADDLRTWHNLADLQGRYQLLTDNSVELVWQLDLNGHVVWTSPAIDSVVGWRADQVLGTPAETWVHPEDLRAFQLLKRRVLSGERVIKAELRHVLPDGDFRWMASRWRPHTNPDGSIIGAVVAMHDVHELVLGREALSRSERQFRLAIDGAPQGMAVVGLHMRFLQVNESLCRSLYREPDWVLEHSLSDVLHPDDLELDLQARDELLTGHQDYAVNERRLATADGGIVWMLHSVGLLRDEHGMPLFYVESFNDITEARRAREALSRSERLFRLAMDGAPQGMAVVDLDRRFLQVNESLCRTLWREPDWLLQHTVTDVMHTDDVELDLATRSQLLAGHGDYAMHERRMVTGSGGVIWVQHSIGLLRDEHGTPLFYVSQFHDITEHRQTREALARSERLFRLAMDGAPQGMAIMGLDRRFQQVNESLCGLLDQDTDWLLQRTIADVLHPEDLDLDTRARSELLVGDSSRVQHECRLTRRDGSVIWVQLSTGLLRDEEGLPLFYVCQFTDVTDAVEARQRLKYQAHHDVLTGLLNRPQLLERIDGIANRSPRTGTHVALLYCDLDLFKHVNDRFGHAVGDELLRIVADRIRSCVRAQDFVSRPGGDEFVVVLDGLHDLDNAVKIADKLRNAVAEPVQLSRAPAAISVSMSVGIAFASRQTPPQNLLRDADDALYAAKHGGRDRVCVHTAGSDVRLPNALQDQQA